MAYNKKKLFDQALKIIEQKKCLFIEQVVAYMPCDKTTFYAKFPIDSNENNAIKEAIEKNKIEIKHALQNKWFKGDNATTQIALYKLIGTEEEAQRLNGSKQEIDHTTNGKPIILRLAGSKENGATE